MCQWLWSNFAKLHWIGPTVDLRAIEISQQKSFSFDYFWRFSYFALKDLWMIQNIDVKKLCAGPSLTMGGCFKLLSPFEKLGVGLERAKARAGKPWAKIRARRNEPWAEVCQAQYCFFRLARIKSAKTTFYLNTSITISPSFEKPGLTRLNEGLGFSNSSLINSSGLVWAQFLKLGLGSGSKKLSLLSFVLPLAESVFSNPLGGILRCRKCVPEISSSSSSYLCIF